MQAQTNELAQKTAEEQTALQNEHKNLESKNKGSRHFVFTINNYTNDNINCLKKIDEQLFNYLIYGFEIGKSGTPHIQGYIEFTKACRFKYVNNLLGNGAWLQIRKGTRAQAREYCQKDGKFYERGTWNDKSQGRRTDLEKLIKANQDNLPILEIMESMPNTYSRHIRFAEKHRALCEKKLARQFRQIKTTVLYGAAGCGKTKYVAEKEENLFWVNPGDAFPFDGYNGEPAIVLDDFYGTLRHDFLLHILDGRELRVNVKGSHRYAFWTRVYITSNKPPNQWYERGLTPELARRLHEIIHFEEPSNSLLSSTILPDEDIKAYLSVTTSCNEVGGNNETPTSDTIDIAHISTCFAPLFESSEATPLPTENKLSVIENRPIELFQIAIPSTPQQNQTTKTTSLPEASKENLELAAAKKIDNPSGN